MTDILLFLQKCDTVDGSSTKLHFPLNHYFIVTTWSFTELPHEIVCYFLMFYPMIHHDPKYTGLVVRRISATHIT